MCLVFGVHHIGEWEFGNIRTGSNSTSYDSNQNVAGAKDGFRAGSKAGAGINRDPKQKQSRIEEQHSGVFFAYSHGVFKDLVASRSMPEPDILMGSEDELESQAALYELTSNELKQKVNQLEQEENEVLETDQEDLKSGFYQDLNEEFNKETKCLDSDDLIEYLAKSDKSLTYYRDYVRRIKEKEIIDRYGLITGFSKVKDVKDLKNNFIEDLFGRLMPAAYVDDLTQSSDNSSDKEQATGISSYGTYNIDKIPIAIIGLPFALISNTAHASDNTDTSSSVSSPKSMLTDQEQATSSSSSTISNIAKIPLALAALPVTLISSIAHSSESQEEIVSSSKDSSSSINPKTSWLFKAYRAFTGERSPEILEWQNINRASVSSIATAFDGISDGEKFCNTKLQNFKKTLNEHVSNRLKDVNNRLLLESLDLSVSDKFILHSKKLAFQTASSAVQHIVPGSTSELREKVLAGAIGSELYFMYKLGEEFKIPGTNVKIAPLGNRKNDSIGKWPHYHRRVPDPKKPNESLPGQGRSRHRPWEVPVDKKGKSLDKKFTDRF